ncbi:MAG: hypothetical protein J0H04_06020, partial [Hyphomicrobium denitrificans]|nr:hypothetical protein [Hyphomicrobium denitrificans]
LHTGGAWRWTPPSMEASKPFWSFRRPRPPLIRYLCSVRVLPGGIIDKCRLFARIVVDFCLVARTISV